MSLKPPPPAVRTALRWLGKQLLRNGWRTGRWIAWIFLPAWIIAFLVGAFAEWLEHA